LWALGADGVSVQGARKLLGVPTTAKGDAVEVARWRGRYDEGRHEVSMSGLDSQDGQG
jgi:hypothetical protein